ncbi:MAG: hypothetical protein HQL13_01050 [Candidatus Omnitrophica bacterium]|nr:hypothetical protein [Candidatus Omnitrophota bacterium]
MKKFLVMVFMMIFVVPAFAAVQNVKISGDITTSFVDRQDFDLGMATTQAVNHGLKSQNIFLTQTRLRIDADLTDNVSTTVGLINERVWNNENSSDNNTNYANDTNVQLYLASITLREFLYSPLSITVGRQIFYYGNGFIIGNNNFNLGNGPLAYIDQDLSLRRSADGVKVVLDYKPLTIDLVYFKLVQTLDSVRGLANLTSGQSINVYGYNLNYQLNDSWNTVLEQYMFAGIAGREETIIVDGVANKGDKWYIPGFRFSTNPFQGLNIQGEFAMQFGNQTVDDIVTAAEKRRAMAGQVMATYALPVMTKYKPSVNVAYTYMSGDKMAETNYGSSDSKDAKYYTQWHSFMSDFGAGTIYGTLFNLGNLNVLSAGASVDLLQDVKASFTWSNVWAADSFGDNNELSMTQPNYYLYLYPDTKNKGQRGLGNEYDVKLKYSYSEDVDFNLVLGWFMPADAFSNINRKAASQALASVAVKF